MDNTNLKISFRVGLTVFFAVLVSYYFSMAEKFWMPLAALLVMQVPTGSSLHHGLQRFLVIVASAMVGSILAVLILEQTILHVILVLIFALGCYFSVRNISNVSVLSMEFLGVLIFLIALIEPGLHASLIYARASDITLGAAMGMSASLLLFPAHPDIEFRQRINVILTVYSAYLLAIQNLILRLPNAEKDVQEKRIAVEKILQTQIPEWVYQPGFNFSLRQGHRYFLIMIEKAGQLLFTMHHAARHEFDSGMRQMLSEPLKKCIEHARKILLTIQKVLDLQPVEENLDDFSEDILALEEAFKTSVTPSLELLYISTDYSSFAALICDLKDFRYVLLKLLEALRVT